MYSPCNWEIKNGDAPIDSGISVFVFPLRSDFYLNCGCVGNIDITVAVEICKLSLIIAQIIYLSQILLNKRYVIYVDFAVEVNVAVLGFDGQRLDYEGASDFVIEIVFVPLHEVGHAAVFIIITHSEFRFGKKHILAVSVCDPFVYAYVYFVAAAVFQLNGYRGFGVCKFNIINIRANIACVINGSASEVFP